ncbi:hypothetical protein C4J65_22005 [Streptomyces sp. CB09001]|uniref:hypothetical protein n=1 Tax=unclassified Streptomyces TaxID=2593676 RepID=UPI000E218143|nr:hypothetical protein [Streptomyces sp. CB09001]AXL90665.1 hypothetical protein C4J65_22005 [Streptomyces sp. CB09001]
MADGDDFYTRDRPRDPDPQLKEDRPRGGGPEDPDGRGTWPVWAIVLVILLGFVVLTVLFG